MAKVSVELSAKKLEALFLIFDSLSLSQVIDMGISVETANALMTDISILSKHHENECKNSLNKAFIELTWK
ncbi:TPA: hypothetical protein ACQ39K_004745 [Yersinia enterocolitica]